MSVCLKCPAPMKFHCTHNFQRERYARAGKPVVRLVPVDGAAPRQPGLLKGLAVPDQLFDPLPEDELAVWE